MSASQPRLDKKEEEESALHLIFYYMVEQIRSQPSEKRNLHNLGIWIEDVINRNAQLIKSKPFFYKMLMIIVSHIDSAYIENDDTTNITQTYLEIEHSLLELEILEETLSNIENNKPIDPSYPIPYFPNI